MSFAAAWRKTHPEQVALYNARRRQPLQTKACEECGVEFSTTRNSGKITKRFCSADCREVRRRRRPGHSVTARTKRKVLERDSWMCYLCQRSIDSTLRWPHPLAGTVDHVIPYSVCRHDRIENLRAAHWTCNEAKGDQLPGTEVWIPGAA